MHWLLERIGIALFWLAWPLWYVYFPRHPRTRVLLVSGNEVLVVKSWLGSGRWGLPGGGLKRGEERVYGALRETHEETGIELEARQLTYLGSEDFAFAGLRYRCHCYAAAVSDKPAMRRQALEISRLVWTKRTQLTVNNATPDLLHIIGRYFR